MMLPTNQKMLSALANIHNEKGELDWEQLLNRSSTFNLLYTLQIVQALMQPSDESPVRSTCNSVLDRQP